ncbi:hypothetical protein Ndes2526B_g00325 [Nannochloris sp. 'desiccata']
MLALVAIFVPVALAQNNHWKNYIFKNIYTGWPQSSSIVAYAAGVVNCTGPYALCAYAECRIVTLGSSSSPAIAECGCFAYPNSSGQDAINIGSTEGMLSASVKDASIEICGTTPKKCVKNTNFAPMCTQQNHLPKPTLYGSLFDIISTFNPATWPAYEPKSNVLCSDGGQYTNCYSAGCLNVPAWNGANATCYCPVYNVNKLEGNFTTTNPSKSCFGSEGFTVGSIVWNGLGITSKG